MNPLHAQLRLGHATAYTFWMSGRAMRDVARGASADRVRELTREWAVGFSQRTEVEVSVFGAELLDVEEFAELELAVDSPGALEELDALCPGDRLQITRCQVLERIADLCDVVLDQRLGAETAVAVERRIGEVAEIALQALAQAVDELCPVALLVPAAQCGELVLDLRALSYANAEGWRNLVLLLRLLKGPPRAAYKLLLLTNMTHQWQRVGIPTLSLFGGSMLNIDSRNTSPESDVADSGRRSWKA